MLSVVRPADLPAKKYIARIQDSRIQSNRGISSFKVHIIYPSSFVYTIFLQANHSFLGDAWDELHCPLLWSNARS